MPVIAVQGERDAFGTADGLRAAAPGIAVVTAAGDGHSLAGARLAPALVEALGLLRVAME